MTIQVRAAGASDLEALLRLNAALFAEDAGRHDPTADLKWPWNAGRQRIADGITDPRRLTLVAVDGDRVVGHLAAAMEDPSVMHMIPVAVLRSLFVEEAHRDGGVGSDLVHAFRAWARNQQAERVAVTAYARNAAAIRFYERHGFTPHEVVLIAPVES